jgi:hypothetical protein
VVYAKTLRMLATEPELDLASLAPVAEAGSPWPGPSRRRVVIGTLIR